MICRPHILLLTVLAFSAAQTYAVPVENSASSSLSSLENSSKVSAKASSSSSAPLQAAPYLYYSSACLECQAIEGGPSEFCGSDGNTYYNFNTLKCINECQNTNVEFRYFGRCSEDNNGIMNYPGNQFPTSFPLPSFPQPSFPQPSFPQPSFPLPSYPQPEVIPEIGTSTAYCPCYQDVERHAIKPICGNDGYTYLNEYHVFCHRTCVNKDVIAVSPGPCFRSQAKCICRIEFYYNDPVCGIDGNTYPNRQALDCSNYCNKQRVSVRNKGSCSLFLYPVPYSSSPANGTKTV